jgi:tight adherence protein B
MREATMDTVTILWIVATAAVSAIAVTLATIRICPVWDSLANRQLGELASQFHRLSLSEEKLRLWLRVWGVTLAASIYLLWSVAKMPPLAIFVAFLVYVAPRYIADYLVRRRSHLLRDQLVASAVALANAVKAGLAVAQGLETVAAETPQPLKTEFDRIVFEYQHGRPLKEAIEAMRIRLNLEEFTLFALAVEVALERGGRLNEALDRICNSLREKQRLERKLTACTAAGQHAIILLSMAPVVFLVGLSVFDSEYYQAVFHLLTGQALLAVTCTLVYLGARWAWKIIHFEF